MIVSIFTTYIYQPFFNLLIFIYWTIQQIPSLTHKDMGVAVIIFTIAFRILLLPLSMASQRSEKERKEIEDKAKKIQETYKSQPTLQREELKLLFRGNHRIVLAETFNLFIQIIIALMLWRIFASGLVGADIHLIYPIMPEISLPFDLTFLNTHDLTQSNLLFNIILTLTLFVVEVIKTMSSPYPASRKEIIRLQFIIPFVSFILFLRLPAGKTLFVIATLWFGLIIKIVAEVRHLLLRYLVPKTEIADEKTSS